MPLLYSLVVLGLLGRGALAGPLECQRHLGASVRRINERLDAAAADLKSRGLLTSPRAWRTETAEFGLPGLDLPAEFGGRGFSTVEMAGIFEHAGRHALDLRDVVGAGHARLLASSPQPAVHDILRGIVRGEHYAAIAITEEGAGSDLHAMTSRAREVENGFLLTGSKLFNARLGNATHVVIFTQSPRKKGRLRAFVISLDHPGLRVTALEAHGLHGNTFGGLTFDKMFVPAELAIGGDDEGGRVFREHFLYWRLMMAAAAVGTGRGALDQTAERLLAREAYGAPIGRFTHLQQALAEHTAKLHMAHLLVREAALAIDERREATALVAMAKAEGVEIALAAADFAMKTFGAEGYSNRVDLGQRVIDLMGLRIADGTTDVLRSEVVRQVYDREFWDLAVGTPPAAGGALIGAPPMFGAPAPDGDDELGGGAASPPEDILAPPAFAEQAQFNGLIRAGGGGACATCTAFNLVQRLRARDPGADLLNPAAVIGDAYLAMPELLDGRVTDAQFGSLLAYLSKYLNHPPLVEIAPAGPEVIAASATEDQIYVYRVYSSQDAYIGRHFVVVRAKNGAEVTVQDPATPYVDLTYTLEVSDDPARGAVRLVRPGVRSRLYLERVVSLR